MAQNLMNNNALQAFQVPRNVYDAIKNAAAKTGVNFTYLMEKAAAESGFDANAKARTSSATGLYQFIESTWLRMVKDHGDKYGLSRYADKISDDGKVASRSDRNQILALRKNPEIASLMAAEFAAGNYDYLKAHVGGEIGSTELYMAHFLGAGGASGFLTAMKKSPNMTAADLFPKEARANRGVFYDPKSGAPRSMREVYAFFDKKFQGAPAQANTVMTANNNLRLNGEEAAQAKARMAAVRMEDDPFSRLAALMNTNPMPVATNSGTMLRIANTQSAQKDWQIFPPSLYGNLSLSPAQMMLLSDFNA